MIKEMKDYENFKKYLDLKPNSINGHEVKNHLFNLKSKLVTRQNDMKLVK